MYSHGRGWGKSARCVWSKLAKSTSLSRGELATESTCAIIAIEYKSEQETIINDTKAPISISKPILQYTSGQVLHMLLFTAEGYLPSLGEVILSVPIAALPPVLADQISSMPFGEMRSTSAFALCAWLCSLRSF